jgi:hypothetical protein
MHVLSDLLRRLGTTAAAPICEAALREMADLGCSPIE